MNKRQTSSPKSVMAGVTAIVPMLIGTAPFGVIFGAYSIDVGLSAGAGQGMSLFVFAGSSQFVGANLYGQGVSLLIIVITTFFINLRHTLYGASLGPRLINTKYRDRVLMSFFLTDETFAVVSQFDKISKRYYWGAALAMYINWQVWTFIGLILGQYFSGITEVNLGFVMVPAFIAIIVPQICDKGTIACAIIAVTLSTLFADFPHQLGLIISAILAIALALYFEKKF